MSSELPCLGRPFHLGMLYDSRSEMLIPGKSLWDSKVIESNMQRRPKPTSNFEIIAEDTLQNKSSSLGIDAKLKLSFLGGLVNVSGAAKYMDDRKSSEQQVRVTLKYSSTTHFEELTMEQIGSIQYPEVFDDVDATHVVSGVLYGSDAYFIFDRNVSKEEKFRDVQGRLEALVKALPGISEISGQATVDMKEGDKKKAEKFTCKFYGDLILPSNPSTFEDAVQVYRELPKLLSGENGDKSVPKLVYLYPLQKLDGRKLKISRSISNSLISKLETIMEAVHTIEVKGNDLLKQEICFKFNDLDNQINKFISLIEQFRMDLVKKIADLLPKIRGNGAEEKELADIISNVYKCPFSPDQITKYLKSKERELKLLAQYLKNLSGVSEIKDCFSDSENEVIAMSTDADYDYIICFAFNVTSCNSAYFDSLEGYLQQSDGKIQPRKEWHEDKNLLRELKSQSIQFVEFVKTNSDKQKVGFAVTDNSEDLSGPGIILYVDGLPEKFEPPGKPEKLRATACTHDSVTLTWSKPDHGANGIEHYDILYGSDGIYNTTKQSDGNATDSSIDGLSPKTKYCFKVQAITRPGVSAESECCIVTTKNLPTIRPAEKFLHFSQKIKSGTPSVYVLPLTTTLADTTIGLFKYDVGLPSNKYKSEKVLMVVGATGAGKSTLINGLANHILGVEWNDNFRFKVISEASESNKSHAHSQTQHITSYSFHSINKPYTLTIIDTPGFGDTGGIEKDKEIARKIKEFFYLPGCIDHIDGIGFVTQASLARLSPTQKYIFGTVLSRFGKDIEDNIFLMTTFADADEPPVLKAVAESDIKYKESFKFNNSAIFANNTQKNSFNSMFWEMGSQSFEDFFGAFTKSTPKSLTMTREVLREREQLETLIPGLQTQIKAGMDKLGEIEQEQRILKQHEDDIKANKNFEYEIDIHKHEKIPLSDVYTTNCMSCCFTCHDNCIYNNNSDKMLCSAMSGEHCKVCPDKCHWTKHENTPFRYKYFDEMIRVKRTHENLKERYYSAQSEKSKHEDMINTSEVILGQLQARIYKVVERARRSTQRLEKIALKPNPLSEIEYLDLLIETEKDEHKEGWQRRVAMCQQLRKDAEILKKLPEIPINDPKNKSWWQFW